MKEIYNTLSKLQVVLAKMFKVEDEIKEIPMALADKEAVLQKTKITYLELHEKSEKVKEELKTLRIRLDEAGVKRETCEKMMETITQAREFETLQKEIEEAKNAEQTLRKGLIAKEKFYDELNAKLSIQEEIMAQQTEEVEEETKVKDQLVAEKQAVLDQIIAEKDELAKDFDQNLLFKFERIIRNKGGLGIVPIHGIVCEGCHMTLPAQFVNDVRRSTTMESEGIREEDDIHFCPYCSRVLYYEESAEDQHFDNLFTSEDEDEIEEENAENDDFISSGDFGDLDSI
ncbi:MAG: zinc ribbon domain-containing protein [Spirochaetales bacterium]